MKPIKVNWWVLHSDDKSPIIMSARTPADAVNALLSTLDPPPPQADHRETEQ